MIEFRKGVSGDGPVIADTRQKAWAATYRGIFPDAVIDDFDYAGHIRRDEIRLQDPDFFYYLVLDNGRCVGYYSCCRIPAGTYEDFRFRLQSLYLLPEYQGKGLGREIMERVFRICAAMGFDKLCWDCSPHNTAAIGFYEHLGARLTRMDTGHENRQEDSCTFEFHFNEGE